ncbi:MAG: PadR family transcriptional regulator [Deltaproteobacteria bacterium]|nr:PadR family transcriptional regulator [Deltaproteobacteria bacterium]
MKDKPPTEYALLGALMSGPRHGYEILQFLESGLGPAWRVSPSQLYVLLRRLKDQDWVSSSIKTQDTRPSKRVFSITPEGETHFLKWVRRPTDHVRDLRIEFLAKLFFLKDLGLEGGEALVNAQIALLEQVNKGFTQKRQGEKDPYKRLIYGFRITTLTGWLKWLQEEAAFFVTK